jgi:TonB family protein
MMKLVSSLTLAALLACLAGAAGASAQSGRVKRGDPPPAPPREHKPPEDGELYSSDAVGDGTPRQRALDAGGGEIYTGREVTRKAVVLSRPAPSYPKGARRNGTHGVVRIRMVLAASGKVENVTVVRGLPDGLSEEAIKAALKIKFEPALKDGVKVSQYVVVEYNFNVY